MPTDRNDRPQPLRPGPETRALRRFHRDAAWTGTIEATPLSPAMTARGTGRFRWSSCGRWDLGRFRQDQFHDGRKVTEWSAEYLAGWDAARRTYVAFAADSNGRSVPFTGVVEGDRFTITSEGPAMGAMRRRASRGTHAIRRSCSGETRSRFPGGRGPSWSPT
jgi:hypothetical protein